MRLLRFLMIAVVGVAAWLVNPRAALRSGVDFDTSWMMGTAAEVLTAARLRSMVEGTWVYRDDAYEVTFRVTQSTRAIGRNARAHRSVISDAYACGDRTLIRSADACIDAWKMPLDIELVAATTAPTGLRGLLTVYAMGRFSGEIWLDLGVTQIVAELAPDSSLSPHGDGRSLRRIAK